jgi:hypothetical protein
MTREFLEGCSRERIALIYFLKRIPVDPYLLIQGLANFFWKGPTGSRTMAPNVYVLILGAGDR